MKTEVVLCDACGKKYNEADMYRGASIRIYHNESVHAKWDLCVPCLIKMQNALVANIKQIRNEST